jgi:hypothetical protein
MSKIGVELKIDVTKIDKARLFKGEQGTYLDATVFIDIDNKDQYNNNGMIVHKQTREESDAKTQTPILGNAKVFWKGEGQSAPQVTQVDNNMDSFDDIPF